MNEIVHGMTLAHPSLTTSLDKLIEIYSILSPYAAPLKPILFLKSGLIAILIFVLTWGFSVSERTILYVIFMVIYCAYFVEDKLANYFKVKKKSKDPASLKIKDKINFYESFNELEQPPTPKLTPLSARRRINQEEFYRGNNRSNMDHNNKKNNLHKRMLSQDGGSDYSPPHPHRVIMEKKDSIDEGDDVGVPSSLLSVLQMEPMVLEKHNSFLDTKNELTDLAREKKVKSTLVLLKKQHPSFVEERLDWVIKEPTTLPTPRAAHTCTLYGTSIVIIGGDGGAADVHFLDTEAMSWGTPRVTGARAAPTSMHGHDCCRIGNRFYIFGGYVNNQLSNKLYVVSLIDDATVHWSQPRVSGNAPSPRMGHSLTRYANKFILWGGFDGRSWLNDVHFLDTDTMTWSQPGVHGVLPAERCGHTATILGDKLLILAGNNCNKEFNDVHVLQLDTMTWIPIDPVGEHPPERTYHAATRIGRNLIMVGGKREGVILKDVWLLSASGSDNKFCWWKVTGNQPAPRAYHSLVRTDTRLFILGGRGVSNVLLDDIWSTNTVGSPISVSSLPVIDYSEIKLEKEIGTGHFSKVIRGIWKQKEVAVKKITIKKEKDKDEIMNEFKSEVELLSNLRHPNMVQCYGYCQSPMCIVMEFLPGNLFDFIHMQKVDFSLLIQFAFDIARGMLYLHSQNIIHRDLKSSNLLLDKHLNVKIADLGIAREASFTQTMTTIGTVAWTAPEILRHDVYNQQADVYSYAIVLWEMITGKVPFEGIPPMNAGILVASNQLRPEIPQDCDPDLRHLVTWCWQEDPSKRPTFDAILAYLTANF